MDTKPRWMSLLAANHVSRRYCVPALALFSAIAMAVVGFQLDAKPALQQEQDTLALESAAMHALAENSLETVALVPPVASRMASVAAYELPALYTVDLIADGDRLTVYTSGDCTVGELLERSGIVLDDNDTLSVDSDVTISQDLTVQVQRVTYREYTQTETLPYETVTQYTHTLGAGRRELVQAGQNGTQQVTYRVRMENGTEVGQEVIDRAVLTPATDEITQVGTSTSLPVSAAPYDIPLDENGQPLNYSRMLSGSTTAYTTERGDAGATTATGRPAQVGVVAVNPAVIPYGTELYIVSADGSYVYGYAIAGDTGGACRSGKVLVDVFLDTYDACTQYGRRNMNVYVLG